MCQDFFDDFFPAGAFCKYRQTGGPHHNSLRDQIEAGQHQSLCSVDSLSDRISKKARIGTDRSISQTFISVFWFFAIHKFTIKYAEYLDSKGYSKDLKILYKRFS